MSPTPAPVPNYSSLTTAKAQANGTFSGTTTFGRALQDNDCIDLAGKNLLLDWTDSPNLLHIFDSVGGGTIDAGTAGGNKVLNLATLLLTDGAFVAGSCKNNVPLNGTLTINFRDVSCDPTIDPGQFGTGFLTMGGTVDMCGSANKTAWVWAQGVTKGSTTLILQSTPNEWNVGDAIVLSGTTLPTGYDNNAQRWTLGVNQDEIFTIAAINGNTITLSGTTQYDHLPMPGPTAQVNYLPVPNLTRNIVFQSRNPSGTRGHCMFMRDMMGNPSVINACHFIVKDCGRTDAMSVVTDPQVDGNGALVPGTAANPRARYAWHSHRQGQAAAALQTWDSGVIWGYKKWGTDNHDSYVNATNMVAYNGQGAGLATERGTEIGTYSNCLSLRTNGSPDQLESRRAADDYGFRGNGCWLQGPGVKVTNCVFGNHTDSGLFVFTTGDPQAGVIASTFPSANLVGTNIPVPSQDYNISLVPYFNISDNTSFCCSTGHTSWDNEPGNIGLQSSLSNLSSWGCPIGLDLIFTIGMEIDGLILQGVNCLPGSVGADLNSGYARQLIFKNPQISGFETGQILSTVGPGSTVSDGTFGNVWDFQVWAQDQPENINQNTLRMLTGTQTYLPVTAANLGSRTRLNFKIDPFLSYVPVDISLSSMFFDIRVTLNDGNQVYFEEQIATYIPVPIYNTYPTDFPMELVGKMNQQLWDSYGLAIAGCIAPAPVVGPTTNGSIGAGQPLVQSYNLLSPLYPTATQAASYFLSYIPTNKNTVDAIVTETTASPLHAGWNLLTRTIDGVKRTFFVYGPSSSPPSPPSPPTPVTTTVTATLTTASAIPAGTYTFSFTAGNQTGSGTFTI